MTQTSFYTQFKNNPMIQKVGALAFLAILVSGIVIAMLAVNRSQELRQRAAVDTTIPGIYFDETTKTFGLNNATKLKLFATVPQGKSILGIQAWVTFNGTIPSDLKLTPAKVGPMTSVQKLTTEGQSRVLSLAHVTEANDEYIGTGQPVLLGELEFTPTTAGTMNISFHNTYTKIEERGSSTNLVQSFPVQSYEFTVSSGPTPTPTVGTATPTPTPIAQATPTPAVGLCNQTCNPDLANSCGDGLTCVAIALGSPCPQGLSCPSNAQYACRNNSCNRDSDCICNATATPTPTPATGGLACNAVCQQNNDCQTGFCYQPPMPSCPPGISCPQVLPEKVCRNQLAPTSTTCSSTAPTPTPGGDVCTSISFQTPANESQVKVGHNLSFTCGQIGNLEYYEFRVIKPDQSIVSLPSVSEKSRTSAPYTVSVKGPHVVQCRACTARARDGGLTGCMNWENVPGM